MSYDLLVMKFGGTNMQDSRAIRHSASLAARSIRAGVKVVVVVSAMAGVTNQLLKLADAAQSGDIAAANDEIALMRTRHFTAAQELGAAPDSGTVREIREMHETLRQAVYGVYLLRELTPRSRDLIVAFGERLSAPLMSLALEQDGLRAHHLSGGEAGILTDSHFGNAKPMPNTYERVRDRLSGLLSAGVTPVVAGFMGETEKGAITTLGRGGTDFSATIVGKALGADEVWAWKDVDGVMSADPRVVKDARNIEVLSYGEVMELAYFGAKVLHPLAVTPLQESGIPLRVKSAADPDFPGTLVQAQARDEAGHPVKAVTAIRNVSIINVSGAGVLGIPEVIASVFDAIARENVTLLMVSQSSSMSNVSLAVQTVDAERTLAALRAGVSLELKVEEQPGVAVLAIVGSGMRGQRGVSARMFTALAEQDVNVLMISQGSSELNVSVAVEADHVDAATLSVHRAFDLGATATA
ncbi:aspartokinase [Deinococcus arenae]|uniref:Aspartokinase n=2 Tax=Deinococcus TaxID=1298 RepID=A0A8H9GKQ2_9DEIO|nr:MULTISPECIES: aspartate kinase [Deinococcus]ALW88813.1 aspartate kinase [Deinococcus actinosclerus]AWT35568.1 aspartate kinase [Deinococcus actinosclerus]GGM33751.1 aspartokinase [Deinococcus arenae]